jgi:hypothetical protein
MSMMTVFRTAIAVQPIALLAQAFLAGLTFSGSAAALNAHMFLGGAILLTSVAQASASVLLRRSARIPGWPVAASIGLLICDAVQMAVGRLQLLALHLPLGMALFGASIAFFIYAWTRPATQNTALLQKRANRSAPEGHPI